MAWRKRAEKDSPKLQQIAQAFLEKNIDCKEPMETTNGFAFDTKTTQADFLNGYAAFMERQNKLVFVLPPKGYTADESLEDRVELAILAQYLPLENESRKEAEKEFEDCFKQCKIPKMLAAVRNIAQGNSPSVEDCQALRYGRSALKDLIRYLEARNKQLLKIEEDGTYSAALVLLNSISTAVRNKSEEHTVDDVLEDVHRIASKKPNEDKDFDEENTYHKVKKEYPFVLSALSHAVSALEEIESNLPGQGLNRLWR